MFESLEKYAIEDTAKVPITTPTGQPVTMDVGGESIALVFTIRNAATAKQADAARKRIEHKRFRETARLSKKERDRPKPPARIEAENREYALEVAVACVADWNLHDHGKPVPCSPENIRSLFEIEKFQFIYRQILDSMHDQSLFDPTRDDIGDDADLTGDGDDAVGDDEVTPEGN